ncbi:MAG: oligosaccharide flippase family protein [Opitutaceae bacterium]|nr:oligosaccharide flippase family protein [Opitutaceae bacterium]
MDEPALQQHLSPDWLPILLAQATGIACGLVGVWVSSTLVSPEIYGAYGLFLTFTPLASLLTHAGMIKHASRNWPDTLDQQAYLAWWLRATLRSAAWLAVVVLLLALAAGLAGNFGLAMIVLTVFPASLAGAYALAFQSCLQSIRRYWADFGLTAFYALTRTFLPLLAVVLLSASFPSLASGYLLHACATAAAGFIVLRAYARPAAGTFSVPGDLGAYHWGFGINGMLIFINAGLVRWTASLFFDQATVGHITLAGNIAMVLPNVLGGACNQYYYPRLLALHQQSRSAALTKLADRALLMLLVICAVAFAALGWVLPWLPGRLIDLQYASCIQYVLPLFSLGTLLGGLSLLQTELLVAEAPQSAWKIAAWTSGALAAGLLLSAARHSTEGLRLWLLASPLVVLPLGRWFTRNALKHRAAG